MRCEPSNAEPAIASEKKVLAKTFLEVAISRSCATKLIDEVKDAGLSLSFRKATLKAAEVWSKAKGQGRFPINSKEKA
jgi:hypothetical protein